MQGQFTRVFGCFVSYPLWHHRWGTDKISQSSIPGCFKIVFVSSVTKMQEGRRNFPTLKFQKRETESKAKQKKEKEECKGMAKGKSPHPSSYYSRISWWRKKAINVEGKCNLNLSCKEKLSKIKVSRDF